MLSFSAPTFWFQEPAARLGSSFAMPPDAVVVKGPALAAVWERSFSAEASSLRFSPWAWGMG
jgi:hypothetical protein